MQVIRLARENPSRTLVEKIVEMFMATRLELTYSKREILALYASNAPFGGNVVGLEAAAWRYYGKRPDQLSWAEAATLAVLPNSPALIHPGRNRNALLAKRNRLLDKLLSEKKIEKFDCELAKEEPLPEQPLPLPQIAQHLLDRLSGQSNNKQFRFLTTINRDLQQRITDILARRQGLYRGNDVHNLAAVVLDVQTGNVLAYVGNVVGAGAEHGESVDVIAAPRSTGSILKPCTPWRSKAAIFCRKACCVTCRRNWAATNQKIFTKPTTARCRPDGRSSARSTCPSYCSFSNTDWKNFTSTSAGLASAP